MSGSMGRASRSRPRSATSPLRTTAGSGSYRKASGGPAGSGSAGCSAASVAAGGRPKSSGPGGWAATEAETQRDREDVARDERREIASPVGPDVLGRHGEPQGVGVHGGDVSHVRQPDQVAADPATQVADVGEGCEPPGPVPGDGLTRGLFQPF